MNQPQETYVALNGTVSGVLFVNDENGYTVLKLDSEDGENVTVTGCMPYAAPGEGLELLGQWVFHSSYGRQFSAVSVVRHRPQGLDAIYRYLAGGAVRGIGPATASVLVTRFGEKTLDVLEFEPEKLATVRGISPKRAKQIAEDLRKKNELRYLMEFLGMHEIPMHFALALFRKFGTNALTKLKENPYVLCAADIGADFFAADSLAVSLGFEGTDDSRISAAIVFELNHNTFNGHVFIPRDKLTAATAQLISLEPEDITECLDYLTESGEVIEEQIAGVDACYLEELYHAETGAADALREMIRPASGRIYDPETLIAELEAEQQIRYADLQKDALRLVAANQTVVITGGPGTGKTTIIRAVIRLFENSGLKVQLAAPTGRAAKRMTELTDRPAQTIHRLLESGVDERTGTMVFRRNHKEPLKCDALILDECSMVDIQLLASLLDALPRRCRLILVGDADQLPSVGPGNAFRDILRSEAFPAVYLKEVFRQAEESLIVRNAHRIIEGETPNLTENRGDFFCLWRSDPQEVVKLVTDLCVRRLPQNMHILPEEIQVLTPSRKSDTGVAALNAALQTALNPPDERKSEKKYADSCFRTGDRVMQIRNNYDIMWSDLSTGEQGTGIFNGDIGYITDVDLYGETLTVNFDGRVAEYDFGLLCDLEHAWAMTVHKSQGSEYRAVILVLKDDTPALLYRSLLYTAVTRARELLIITGDEAAVHRMIANHRQTRRYSGLRARLTAE